MFESGVLAFLPIYASKGVILISPCGVILNVLIISETINAILNGVFLSIFMTPSRRLYQSFDDTNRSMVVYRRKQ